jgi:hypothetical protein
MMANAARDPYWQAAVRRETIEHPSDSASIEDECSICHMPMMRYEAKSAGQHGTIFERLPIGSKDSRSDLQAADGVSCTACHQITDQGFGKRESFIRSNTRKS